MEAITKTRRIGGSLAVTIPHEIVEHECLMENQTIKITVQKVQKTGFGMFKGVAPFAKDSKFKGQLEKNG